MILHSLKHNKKFTSFRNRVLNLGLQIRDVKEPEKYELLETEISHFARALGHPARIAILLAMAKKGNSMEGEIVEIPQLSRATVIQHLRELKRAGLIHGKIFGTKAVYKIDFDNLNKFFNSFESFMDQTLPSNLSEG